METQTQAAPTTTSVPVSFENVTLEHLGFNETYRVLVDQHHK